MFEIGPIPEPIVLCECGRVRLIAPRAIVVQQKRGTAALEGLPGWNHFACGNCGDDLGVFAWSEPWRICVVSESNEEEEDA